MSLLSHLKVLHQRFSHNIRDDAQDLERGALSEIRLAMDEASRELESFGESLKHFGTEYIDEIFTVLRRLQPILVTKKLAVLTRYDDVQEVLSADDAFDAPYAARMREITDGENFFLGMRDTPRYTRDHSNMMIAVRREDVATIVAPFVAGTARQLVAAADSGFNVVSELTQIVPARLTASYFGVGGDRQADMIEWTSALFWFLFLDQEGSPEVRERALKASMGLNAYLDEAIAARKKNPGCYDDVLGRCMAQQGLAVPGTSDLDIRNNLVGLLIGAIPTTATTAALALDSLLDRPESLQGAQAAALAEDDELLARYVFEALRFNPMNPGIFRVARRDYTVARGEGRATMIPEGTTVIAATRSAMFDPLNVEDPRAFRIDRPSRDYMLWGHGMHTCFGQYINQAQIPQLLKPLLRRKNLRRVDGSLGKLQLEGPFAHALHLLFD